MDATEDDMTPQQIRDLRRSLGMSQANFALLLGMDGSDAGRTVRGWEADPPRSIPTGPCQRVMQLILAAERDGWDWRRGVHS